MAFEPLLLALSFHREPVALRPVEASGKRSHRNQKIHYFSVAGCSYPGSLGPPSIFPCFGPALFHGSAQRAESGFPAAAGRPVGVVYRVFGLVVDE